MQISYEFLFQKAMKERLGKIGNFVPIKVSSN